VACAKFKTAKRRGSIHGLVLRTGDMVTTGYVVVIGDEDDTLRGNIRDQTTGREVGETLHRTGKSVLSDVPIYSRSPLAPKCMRSCVR
jgi:hypothetical protein